MLLVSWWDKQVDVMAMARCFFCSCPCFIMITGPSESDSWFHVFALLGWWLNMHVLPAVHSLDSPVAAVARFVVSVTSIDFIYSIQAHFMPSVLWRYWLGGRKGIWPVKNWVVGCWRGYLSGARCRLAYSPADATATHCLLLLQNPDWFYLSGTGSPG